MRHRFRHLSFESLERRQLLASDPVAHWQLDEGFGNVAGDSAGGGHDGTLVDGPVWSTGVDGGALHFDGVNDWVSVPESSFDFVSWSGLTVSAWVKHDVGAEGQTNDIISQWDFPANKSWLLTHHNNNQYFWEISGIANISGGTVSTDWTHVAGTYDQSSGTMRLYVNGQQVAVQTGLSGGLPASPADVVLASQADNSNYFDGLIDDVRIYDRELLASEVSSLAALNDSTPPTLNAAEALSATEVLVTFDEMLDAATAETASNYTIDNGVIVTAASLNMDGQTVTLTTSPQTIGNTYQLTVGGVQDLNNNSMSPEVISYVFSNDDPFFNLQWGLHNTGQFGGTPGADISATDAWGVQTGSSNVVVAVLDSGIDYSHADLASNMWVNLNEVPNNGIDDDANSYVDDYQGWDFFNNDNDPMDDNGHGTHVAGIMGAVGQNGIGVAGLNHDVSVMNLKFIGPNNVGTIQGAIDAIDYAVSMGADVISNSWVVSAAWGEPGYDEPGFAPALKAAIERASQAGVLFVAAAGNFQINTDITPQYPASYDNENIMSVTASDDADVLASFANFGAASVDLSAPGTHIYSTVPTGSCTFCDSSGYAYVDGSSMSTAFVSGAAALIKSQYPSLSGAQIKSRIMYSGNPVPSLQGSTVTGKRLNAFNALENDSAAPATISDLIVANKGSRFIDLNWTSVGDDGTTGTAVEYDVRYATFPIDEDNFDSVPRVTSIDAPQVSGSPESLRVGGLAPSTTYYFAAKTIDNVGIVSSISNTVGDTTLQDGDDLSLLLHLPLDEANGLTAFDISGNAHDGTLVNGPVWTGGQLGGALDFDGQNDYVEVPSGPFDFATWSGITVAAWVKHDIGAEGQTNDILSHWDYPSDKGWLLTHHHNNQYFWEIGGKAATSGGTVSSDWTHVTGTYDAAAGEMKLYVNGLEVATQSGLSGSLPASLANLRIASQANGGQYFDGLIDDVRIYDRALSANEAATLPGLTQHTITVTTIGNGSVSLDAPPDYFVGQDVTFTAVADPGWRFTGWSGDLLGRADQKSLVVSGDHQVSATFEPTTAAPAIDIWYGNNQTFGQLGNPQQWVNILGNVFDPDGMTSLTFSLNGGPNQSLSIGPDSRRLQMDGDFVVEIDYLDLNDGMNDVTITATDTVSNVTVEVVTVDYSAGNTWPLPYSIEWNSVTDIQDVLQVVDGDWALVNGGVRTADVGYDRVLSIGDLIWDDVEITVPMTVHAIDADGFLPPSNSPGFGLTARWTGHTDSPVNCAQPHCGWLPSGAGAWYDIGGNGPLLLDGNSDNSVQINVGDTFYWKFRVETVAGVGPLYSLKVWDNAQPEPISWNLAKQRALGDVSNGSLILNAHHVDLTFGDISIVPLS